MSTVASSAEAFVWVTDGTTVTTSDQNGTVQRFSVAPVFRDSAALLCSDVGLLSSDNWNHYAPNETEPTTCAR